MREAAAVVAAVLRPEIRALSAYAVAHAEGMIKLDAMENPFPLPAAIRAKIAAVVADVPVNRYPDGGARGVKAALRSTLSLPDSAGLILGNGSDELIQIIASALARPGATMLAPEPSFVMYRLNALYAGMRFVGVPLTAGFALDAAAMRVAIERERPALVFIAYPNNPTGNLFDAVAIEDILQRAPGLVVIDEAYYAFADASFLPRVGEFPNLVVLRTVSKIGMAGLRLGYAVGAREWTTELDKLRQPYNLNALTQAVAPLLLAEGGLLAEQAATLKAERARLHAALAALPGVEPMRTQTNFVLARVPDAPRWFEGLRQSGNPREESAWLAPAARSLSAHHRRHAGRERRARRCAESTSLNMATSPKRTAKVERNTSETRISVEVNLDGTGRAELATGVPFLDHMLDQLARHSMMDLAIRAEGDLHIDAHHTVEDIGITLGQAVAKALGDKKGLARYGHAYVPLDEALSRVVVDLSGRPGLEFHVPFTRAMIGAFDVDLTHEFFQGFANHALVTLHIDNLRGQNAHHQAETVFKAFARALRMAIAPDARAAGVVPSTKGSL